MPQAYKVVFTGALRPGVRVEDAMREFASVFKVDESQASGLIRAGQERVLKSDVDDVNAQRYLDVLGDIGLEARIEPMDGSPAPSSERAPPTATGAAPPAGDDAPLSRPLPGASVRPASAPPPVPDRSQPASNAMREPPPQTSGMPRPRGRPASHGWAWIKEAWTLFKQQPRGWLMALALVYLVTFVISLVPVIGSLATMILGPIFAGGLMIGAQAQQRTGVVEASTGFRGFSTRGGQLALVGVLYLLGLLLSVVAAGLVVTLAGGVTLSSLEALSSSDPEVVAAALGPGVALFALMVMLFVIPLLMAYWFAPALVALDEMTAIQAMAASFQGCLKNILPYLVYGLMLFLILLGFSLLLGVVTGLLAAINDVFAILMVFLMIPLMLVFAAVVVLSIFTAYREVFHSDQPPSGSVLF